MATLGITLAITLGMVILLSTVRRLRQRKALETIDIMVMGAIEDLAQRERIKTIVVGLDLGRVNSVRNAKTDEETMHVWLQVPNAAAAVPLVERALAGQSVAVRVLGPPLDMTITASLRRSLPLLKEGLLKNWRDSGDA